MAVKDIGFRPVADRSAVAACVASVLDAQTLPDWPAGRPPSPRQPIAPPTRVSEVRKLKIGEAMIVWYDLNGLMAVTPNDGREFRVEKREAGGWIIERVR